MLDLLEITGAPGQLVVLSWIAYEVFRLRTIVEPLRKRTLELEKTVYGTESSHST
jgi:hypothetical protein